MTRQFLTFDIDGQIYAFPIEKVREINRIGEVTKVPNAPSYYSGVMNLRGSIISVVSLRLKLGLPVQENTSVTCTVVVDCAGQKVATVVDAVRSVVNIEDHQIEPNTVVQNETNYIEQIAKLENQIIMLVDIEKCLVSATEKVELSLVA